MNKKVTYYLGAGASANAIPVLSEFSDRIRAFKLFLHDYCIKNKRNTKVNERLNKIAEAVRNEFSPDTLAKKFYHIALVSDDFSDYIFLKRYLTAFLIFEQSVLDDREVRAAIDKMGFPLDEASTKREKQQLIKKINSINIDSRYDSMIATLINSDLENGIPLWDNNVNFISWNYDSQIELSYNQFTNQDLSEVKKYLSQYLVKLNGSATTCSEEILPIEDIRKQKMNMASDFFDYIMSNDETNLSFAWESNERQVTEINRASKILSDTDILVIIGYSFPYYNRNIDTEILKNFIVKREDAQSRINTIVVQDPDIERFPTIKRTLFDLVGKDAAGYLNFERFDWVVRQELDKTQFYIPM